MENNNRLPYLVTDSLCVSTGSYDSITNAIKAAYSQLRGTTYLKDARTISKLGEDGIYAPIGTYQLISGHINWSIGVVRHWRERMKEAGEPHYLQAYYQTFDVCPKCKGNKGKMEYVSSSMGYIVTEQCGWCKGAGNYVAPPPNSYRLVVREMIYNDTGAGMKPVDMVLEAGTLGTCIKCFKDIKAAYTDESQFRVENDCGKIVGIQAHGEILWLANVPPPNYWGKPAPPKPPAPEQPEPEICMAGGWANND